MLCSSCKKLIPDSSKFCPYCGAQPYQAPQQFQPQTPQPYQPAQHPQPQAPPPPQQQAPPPQMPHHTPQHQYQPPPPGAPPQQHQYQAPPPPQGVPADQVDFGRAFGFVFQDKGWFGKMILFVLIGCVPILNFACLGYLVELAQRTCSGQDTPLPDIKLGEQFGNGFMFFLAFLIFGIMISIIIIPIMIISIFLLPLAFIVMLFMIAYMISATGIAAAENNPWVIFSISRCMSATTKNFGQVILVALMSLVLGFIAQAGVILFIVGLIFTIPYSMFVNWHYTGQVGRIIKMQNM